MREKTNLKQFVGRRRSLCLLLEEMSALPSALSLAGGSKADTQTTISQVLLELKDVIEDDRFRIAIIGEFSTGKSSLLNVLLDQVASDGKRAEGLLPTSISVTTPAVTSIYFSKDPEAFVELTDGTKLEVDLEELSAYLSTPALKKKWPWKRDAEEKEEIARHVREVRLGLDADLLRHGVEILDTPGLGSVYAEHAAITERCVSAVDAAVFLVAADPPMGELEMTFLQYISGFTDRLLFVMTKTDLSLGDEGGLPVLQLRLQDSQKRIAQVLRGIPPTIFRVSAVRAAKARRTSDVALMDSSGVPALRLELERLLAEVRGAERLSVWTSRAKLAASIIASTLKGEESQLNARVQQLEIPSGTEGDYMQWQAAIPLFQDHMREMRSKFRRQIGNDLPHVINSVRREVMPVFTSMTPQALAINEDKRFRLERTLVEAVQRQTAKALDPTITDATADAELAVAQTLGQNVPRTIAQVQGSVDAGQILSGMRMSLDASQFVISRTDIRTRSPHGFWEKVKKFFGTRYIEEIQVYEIKEDHFVAVLENTVQESVHEIQHALDQFLQSIAQGTGTEMKRLEEAAKESDRRASAMQQQTIAEVKDRLAEVRRQLDSLDSICRRVSSLLEESEAAVTTS